MKAVHFGAGNIGRGFVAEFLHNSGYEVVFADVMEAIIKQLQDTKSYTVEELGTESNETHTIDNYRAINSKTHEADVIEEISTADIVTCAVGPNILKFLAPVVAKGIEKRAHGKTPLAVIACENVIGGTSILEKHILEPANTPAARLSTIGQRARFANSAIDRIVPGQDPNAGLNIKIEKFYEWVVEQKPFAPHGPPKINGIHWVDDLLPYIERKLFTVNTSHAAAAYYGCHAGKKTIEDAMNDKKINDAVRACLSETSKLIVEKHGIPAAEQKEYVEKIIKRISNPHLKDAVERVGRDPMRKLGKDERFVGPARQLVERKGTMPVALLGAIEMALRFQNIEGDEASKTLAGILKDDGSKEATEKITGLAPDHGLFAEIEKKVKLVQGAK